MFCSSFERRKEKLFEKYNLGAQCNNNKRMPEGITKYEALVMILHLYLRFGMEEDFLQQVLNFCAILLGEELLPSVYLFKELFGFNKNFEKHYFCRNCKLYFGLENVSLFDIYS